MTSSTVDRPFRALVSGLPPTRTVTVIGTAASPMQGVAQARPLSPGNLAREVSVHVQAAGDICAPAAAPPPSAGHGRGRMGSDAPARRRVRACGRNGY